MSSSPECHLRFSKHEIISTIARGGDEMGRVYSYNHAFHVISMQYLLKAAFLSAPQWSTPLPQAPPSNRTKVASNTASTMRPFKLSEGTDETASWRQRNQNMQMERRWRHLRSIRTTHPRPLESKANNEYVKSLSDKVYINTHLCPLRSICDHYPSGPLLTRQSFRSAGHKGWGNCRAELKERNPIATSKKKKSVQTRLGPMFRNNFTNTNTQAKSSDGPNPHHATRVN